MIKVWIYSLLILVPIVGSIYYDPGCVRPDQVEQCIQAKCANSISSSCEATTTAYIGGNQCCDKSTVMRLSSNGKRIYKRQAYNFIKYPASKWTMPIKYHYNDSITLAMRNTVEEAMRIIQEMTCVRFLRVTTAPLSNINDPYMSFNLDQSCVSFVGKSAEQKSPILGTAACFNEIGTMLYLITQSLGMWHQTQRPDSNLYVSINYSNLNPSNKFDFILINSDELVTFGYPYDFASIMSFPPKVYSVNGKQTITTLEVGFTNTIGQRAEYSYQDAKLINKLYCDCPTQLICNNGGYTDPLNCAKCRCPDGFSGVYCEMIYASSSNLVSEADCGGELQAKYIEKYIYSPGYNSPGYYPLSATCVWHIKGDNISKIRLRFVDDFGLYIDPLSACQHWVEVKYTAPLNTTSYRYCDTHRPTATMFASTNDVIVVFKSKFQKVGVADRRGFKLSYLLVCGDNTCLNGGVCFGDSCKCLPGFYGIQCEEGVTPGCNSNPCKNNGSCVSTSGSNFTCLCPMYFSGKYCENVVTNTNCNPNPCKNNGTCVPLSATSSTCKCLPKVYGTYCQNADCGGCNVFPGVKQEKCCTGSKTSCFRLVYLYQCGKMGCSNKPTVQNYPCSNSTFCCDNAVEFDGSCYVIGWSLNGPCSKSCGGGTSVQKRYDVVYTNNIPYYQVIETRSRACNEFDCPTYNDGSSSSDDDGNYGNHHHHMWWFKK